MVGYNNTARGFFANEETQDGQSRCLAISENVSHGFIRNYLFAYAMNDATYGKKPLCLTDHLLNTIDWTSAKDGEDLDVTTATKEQFGYGIDLVLLTASDEGESPQNRAECLKCFEINVIDYKGNNIRDFSVLPLLISSGVEGSWLQFWREMDSRITYEDIIARIPVKASSSRDDSIEPIIDKTELRRRAENFRRRQVWKQQREIGSQMAEGLPEIKNSGRILEAKGGKASDHDVTGYVSRTRDASSSGR